ncbi:ABC transporter permease [Georgenia halophila]|uniref:ABC transporter permease n=1 Tax=Georgenia halophila TaxID=620889 RepID=A0ABP8L4U0_9MICO
MTAARPTRRVLAQTRFETAAVLRNGEQLLLTLVLPVIALVVMVRTDLVPLPGPDAARPAGAVAGVLALAVASHVTSQSISLAFDRRWGVLRLLATTPLGPRGLLAGRLGAVLVVLAVQAAVVLTAGLLLGWRPDPSTSVVLGSVLLIAEGAAAFVALAMLLGGTLRPEAVLALANLLWVLMAAGGGLLVPAESLPAALAAVVRVLPSGALGEGMRTLATTGGLDPYAVAVLAVWTVVGAWLAARFFRWD